MNAPVSQTLRDEAARSLLERFKERTSLARLFRWNAALKHGVPESAIDGRAVPMPSVPAAPRSSLGKILAAAVVGSGLVGGSGVAGYYLAKNAVQPPTSSVQQESPLQYLEDIGEHLP